MRDSLKRLFACSFALSAMLITAGVGSAQVEQPDREKVFEEDSKDAKKIREDKIKEALKQASKPSQDFDFKAPKIEYLKEQNQIRGTGGVVVSQGGLQVQGEEAIVNMNTKDATLKNNVVVSSTEGDLISNTADLNLDSETGKFGDASFTFDESGYSVTAAEANKISEFEFKLKGAEFSTCHCLDGDKPWKISSSSCSITQEGYAHAYDSTVLFQGVPIFYTPWLVFPAKTKRASGLLAPEYGISSEDGFQFKQPIFLSIDESTDLFINPFIETETRIGSEFALRKLFSERSNINTKMIYSNESKRGDDLRGVDVTGLPDPSIAENRFGGFYQQIWRPAPELDLPIEFIADGHYTNDDLFVREIEDDNIGARDSQYLTSTAVFRATLLDSITAEASTEYNQGIVDPDDIMLQRLPQLAMATSQTLRPFGFNPYGTKLVLGGDVLATNFQRDESYDGWRMDIHPTVKMPFHVSNYFKGQLFAELHQTNYSMDETLDTSTGIELDDSNSRTVPIFGAAVGTGVEKVYDLEKGNWLSNFVGMGSRNAGSELVRLKHTIEPVVQYAYIPFEKQSDLPIYDSLDRYNERSLVTYGATTRLYGRFSTPLSRNRDIGELAPSVDDLPTIDVGKSLSEFGSTPDLMVKGDVVRRPGEIQQLASFSLKQSYDYLEDHDDNDPTRDALSDVNARLTLSPSSYFGFLLGGNYGVEDHGPSSYEIGLGVSDDREDLMRLRYSYTDSQISQIEGNIEVKLHERLRLGYYGRYDDLEGEFIENTGLLRFSSACNCWSIDLGVSETVNPDKEQVMLTFTFAGLGDITQGIGVPQDNSDGQ